MNDALLRKPISQMSRDEFNEVYDSIEIKYRDTSKWMSPEGVLTAALSTGQITAEKYNELI